MALKTHGYHYRNASETEKALMIYVYYYYDPQKADEGLRKTFCVSIILYIYTYIHIYMTICILLFLLFIAFLKNVLTTSPVHTVLKLVITIILYLL